jgi:hypothetical protein
VPLRLAGDLQPNVLGILQRGPRLNALVIVPADRVIGRQEVEPLPAVPVDRIEQDFISAIEASTQQGIDP